jgi:hypothetical protein
MFKLEDTQQSVNVLSVSGGWTTVELPDGTTRKVRNSNVVEVKTVMTTPLQGKSAKIKDTQFALDRYVVTDIKTPSGRRAMDCDDDISKALRGMDIDQVYATAALNLECPEDELRAKYGHLNIGMQRMNLGNRIRGAEKSKETTRKKMEAAKKRESLIALRAEERARQQAERAVLKEQVKLDKLAARAARKPVLEVVAVA